MFQQQRFDILTDTGGDFVDSGSPFTGLVRQIRYILDGTSPLDTGADIRLEMVHSGVVIAHYENVGGASFTRVPRISSFDTGGAEIGDAFACASRDKMRLTVTQSAGVAGSKAGTILVVTSD